MRSARTNLSWSCAVSKARLLHRLRADSPEPGAFRSMTRLTRASTPPTSSAPEVSSDTSNPASHRRASRSRQRFCASGSPPVTQTWRARYLPTSSTMSAMSRHCPPWNAYSVSHHTQRSGQPVRRTNTVGRPASRASPCREWNISVTRRRPAESTSDIDRLALCFDPQRPQPTLREVRHGRIGILLQNLVQGGLRLVPLLHFVLAVADLEQCVGRLLAVRILRQQLAEGVEGNRIILRDVVAFAEPVIGVRGQLVVRKLGDELLEQARRFGVASVLERTERGIIGRFRILCGSRRCDGSGGIGLHRRLGRGGSACHGCRGGCRSLGRLRASQLHVLLHGGAIRIRGARGSGSGGRIASFQTTDARIQVDVLILAVALQFVDLMTQFLDLALQILQLRL